eukprot:1689077-Pyramimonas_sp.AAC.1
MAARIAWQAAGEQFLWTGDRACGVIRRRLEICLVLDMCIYRWGQVWPKWMEHMGRENQQIGTKDGLVCQRGDHGGRPQIDAVHSDYPEDENG